MTQFCDRSSNEAMSCVVFFPKQKKSLRSLFKKIFLLLFKIEREILQNRT